MMINLEALIEGRIKLLVNDGSGVAYEIGSINLEDKEFVKRNHAQYNQGTIPFDKATIVVIDQPGVTKDGDVVPWTIPR